MQCSCMCVYVGGGMHSGGGRWVWVEGCVWGGWGVCVVCVLICVSVYEHTYIKLGQ